MIKNEIKRSKIANIILIVLLFVILILCIFPYQMEVLLHLRPSIPNSTSTQIHFIDVGQGDAIAIKFPNGKVMLVDSGTKEYESKLSNYLDNVVLCGSKNIDYVVLTHPDIDHSGNMKFILEKYNVNKFFRPAIYEVSENKTPYCVNEVYGEIIETLDKYNIETEIVSNKIFYEFGVKINMLTPYIYSSDLNELSTNDFSCVLVINDGGKKVLLGGDISDDMEEILINNFDKNLLDCDILKLSHHGSKYSNSMDFINATSPEYIVVCCGENTYGHPANDTLHRLLEYDVGNDTRIFDTLSSTQTMGNIVFSLENDIKRSIIKNIDDYNFVSFYIYAIIFFVYILYVLMLPYFKIWKENRRFDLQNKHYTYYKEQEKQLLQSKRRNFK